jgi:hypothetical protein
MANYDFWALGEASVTVSGGGQLDGVTQGDGSHLVGLTITLTSSNFEQIEVRDGGSDTNFDDNDGNQRLRGTQDFDGVTYGNNTGIEAEYQMVLRDPNTGIEYRAISININNSSPSYATIEGIAFVDVIPPRNVALEVISASEGPGSSGQPPLGSGSIAPPCFTPGTKIATPTGLARIEDLKVGDLVHTLDHGAQPLIWVGQVMVSSLRMALRPAFRPVRIAKGALGQGMPVRDMMVSPQHRILVQGPQAELLFGAPQVLAAAIHLINGTTITRAWDVDTTTYFHLQCAQHEILVSDGLPSESFNPGPASLFALQDSACAELRALFPDRDLNHAAPLTSARPLINRAEAALWSARAA